MEHSQHAVSSWAKNNYVFYITATSMKLIIVIDCGPLTAPSKGQVNTSSGTIFGSTAMYTCDTGYTLSGSQTRTCEAGGNWSSIDPVCILKGPGNHGYTFHIRFKLCCFTNNKFNTP